MRTPHSWRSLSLMGERKDVQGSWDFPRLAALNFLSFSLRELHASIMSQSYFCKMCRKIYLRNIFGEASRNLSFNLLSAPSNRSRFIQSYLFRNSTRSWVVQSDGSYRLYRYLWKPRSSLEVSREKETLCLLRETNKSFSRSRIFASKEREDTHTHSLPDDTCEIRDERDGGVESYFKVFRELKQIPRSWWIRLLVRASKTHRLLPLLLSSPSSSSSASAIRSIPGFTYRRRNCECRRPCNCESSKKNGNFPPNLAAAGEKGTSADNAVH